MDKTLTPQTNESPGETDKPLSEWSDEELRVKVAELCGKHLTSVPPLWYDIAKPIPNYPSDLNAMHEAEEVLTNAQLWEYHHRLNEVKGLGGNNHWKTPFATARQRAEAFVATLSPQSSVSHAAAGRR